KTCLTNFLEVDLFHDKIC
ncbi:hypothetical protein DBR06_SOUSAS1210082, partial [Sousa chinensis]